VLAGRSRIAEFGGAVSPNFFAMTLFRPFSQLFSNVDPHLYALFAVLAVSPVIALVVSRERTFTDRLTTYLAAIITMLVISPASNSLYVVYVYFPLLCLLYLDTGQRGQAYLLAGTIAIAFPVQPAQIRTALGTLNTPASVSMQILEIVRDVLSVASVPLAGLLVIFGWCLFHATRESADPNVDVQPTHAD
jgi:hypothetical protein